VSLPPDPFIDQDTTNLANGIFAFYSALMAAGFAEGRAMYLTGLFVTQMVSNVQQQQAKATGGV
jgi:hypothetical protein